MVGTCSLTTNRSFALSTRREQVNSDSGHGHFSRRNYPVFRGSVDPVSSATMRQPSMEKANFAEFEHLASNALTLEIMLDVASHIMADHDYDPSGAFVVVQRSDTLEDTSFLLDLLLPRTIPVVATGAMRTADALGADGPANLADASQQIGVVVCMA